MTCPREAQSRSAGVGQVLPMRVVSHHHLNVNFRAALKRQSTWFSSTNDWLRNPKHVAWGLILSTLSNCLEDSLSSC